MPKRTNEHQLTKEEYDAGADHVGDGGNASGGFSRASEAELQQRRRVRAKRPTAAAMMKASSLASSAAPLTAAAGGSGGSSSPASNPFANVSLKPTADSATGAGSLFQFGTSSGTSPSSSAPAAKKPFSFGGATSSSTAPAPTTTNPTFSFGAAASSSSSLAGSSGKPPAFSFQPSTSTAPALSSTQPTSLATPFDFKSAATKKDDKPPTGKPPTTALTSWNTSSTTTTAASSSTSKDWVKLAYKRFVTDMNNAAMTNPGIMGQDWTTALLQFRAEMDADSPLPSVGRDFTMPAKWRKLLNENDLPASGENTIAAATPSSAGPASKRTRTAPPAAKPAAAAPVPPAPANTEGPPAENERDRILPSNDEGWETVHTSDTVSIFRKVDDKWAKFATGVLRLQTETGGAKKKSRILMRDSKGLKVLINMLINSSMDFQHRTGKQKSTEIGMIAFVGCNDPAGKVFDMFNIKSRLAASTTLLEKLEELKQKS